MKKLSPLSAFAVLGLTTSILAGNLPEKMGETPLASTPADTGLYLGLEGGFGMDNWDNIAFSSNKNNGVVGRIFAGYDINKYFATEVGYTYFFNKAEIKTNNTSDYFKIRTQSIDLLGKVKVPLSSEINFYGKFGVNYLLSKTEVTGTVIGASDETRKAFNIAYGLGVDYYITPNIVANAEWLRHNGDPKTVDTRYQPYADSFMLGLRYQFDL